jgi:hypothetical protein
MVKDEEVRDPRVDGWVFPDAPIGPTWPESLLGASLMPEWAQADERPTRVEELRRRLRP